jgi:hypothetical protein
MNPVPEVETHRVVYTGPAPFVGLVAQTLRAEGLRVATPEPDVEERGVGEVLDQVTVSLIVTATTAAVRAAVVKARERLRNRGTVKLEDATDGDE